MSAGDDDATEILRQQLEASRRAAAESNRITDHVALAEGLDRSWIARGVVQMFVVVIIGVLAIFLVEGLTSGDWRSVAQQAADLVRSDLLPVVTLILGYYFGRSGRI